MGIFETVKPKYLDLIGACVYTSFTHDQIEHAVKNGHLTVFISKNNVKRFDTDQLDELVRHEVLCGKERKPYKAS